MGAPSLKPMPGMPGSSLVNPLGRAGPPGMPGSFKPPGFGGGHNSQPPIGHSGQVLDPTDPGALAQFKQGQSPLQTAMTQRMVGGQAPNPMSANPFANNGVPQMMPQQSMPPVTANLPALQPMGGMTLNSPFTRPFAFGAPQQASDTYMQADRPSGWDRNKN